MTKKTPLPAHSLKYTFAIPVVLSLTAPVDLKMQNVVYACADNMVGNPTGPNGEVICGNPNPPPPPPVDQCDKTTPTPQKDPACISTSRGFDLSLKKYVDNLSQDAQPGSAVAKNPNDVFAYVIRVSNIGPSPTSGITTVRDTLPAGVSATGAATGIGWTCAYDTLTLTCMSSQVVASGSAYSDISVPVKVTATSGTITNYAIVHNPSETNPCKTDNSLPTGNETSCEKDSKNIDPALIKLGTDST